MADWRCRLGIHRWETDWPAIHEFFDRPDAPGIIGWPGGYDFLCCVRCGKRVQG